ncbi:MAG: hypothetical protein COV67_07855 [Nitrospinae bacterium CG11_big_fil_rev_8_21_14_0_20_56_8]|nr:MAG: hypothetical protein COV67_07855 [Nitrospinae bacterium CG11_big_fil_rev_8_21_14_0_20_56_8]
MNPHFESLAQNYNTVVDRALQSTGFDTDHFVRAKLNTLSRIFPGLKQEPFDFLDFGCGAGNLFAFFPDVFPAAHYTGADLSESLIRQAHRRFGENAPFCNLEAPQWSDRKYDLILAAGVFHHIPREQQGPCLERLGALLKSDGKVLLWEHNPLNPFTRRIVRDCEIDRDAILIPPGQMKRLMRSLSLDRPRIIYTTFFPSLLKCLLPLEPALGWFPLGGQYIASAGPRQPARVISDNGSVPAPTGRD